MGPEQTGIQVNSKIAILALALLQGACAANTAAPTPLPAGDAGDPDLGCLLPSNCVSSIGNGASPPLVFAGTPAQAMAVLQATVKSFPEVTIVRAGPLALEVIFTTPAGFRDEVDFRIDPAAQRIDFRSRSSFGLFDFGKNRSRMQEFKTRYERQAGP
jgi:uncharacterized protein (DUF1499 family)